MGIPGLNRQPSHTLNALILLLLLLHIPPIVHASRGTPTLINGLHTLVQPETPPAIHPSTQLVPYQAKTTVTATNPGSSIALKTVLYNWQIIQDPRNGFAVMADVF